MSDEVAAGATVTPIKPLTGSVMPPEASTTDAEPLTMEAEPLLQETAGVPVATVAEPAAQTRLATSGLRQARHALEQRLQVLTTRTLPLAWYRLTRVGPAGLIGAAATLAAILITVVAVIGERGATSRLLAQIANAQAHPTLAAVSDAGVGKVISSLPTRQEIPAVVAVVLEQARAANVALDSGHYSYSAPKSGTVGRYELEFPVKADYPSVRNFINRTLSAVPAAGLDKLHIERKVVGDPVVSADIRFVVFVRAGS